VGCHKLLQTPPTPLPAVGGVLPIRRKLEQYGKVGLV
jgi:hypothetical protein